MPDRRLPILVCAALVLATPLGAQQPLSAIDWLSKSVVMPAGSKVRTRGSEKAVAPEGKALPQDVVTSTLDGPAPDGSGVLVPAQTGLPRDLWGIGRTAEIAARITRERPGAVPALQDLLISVLLARARAPADSANGSTLLLARIDKLLELGALDQAQALLDASGPMTPTLFRRAFDVALLLGTEDHACEILRATPDLSPTYPARIFCLARTGDWNAAALTLRMAQALDYVTPSEDRLVSRFLDPDLAEEGDDLLPPPRITPLVWRMLDASGEAPPTATLPLAFSHIDLRDTAGWKAQCEAVERLARAGDLDPSVMEAILTAREPAASGGIWDRIAAFQRLDAAARSGKAEAIASALPPAWGAMKEAETEAPFARLFAARLLRPDLPARESAVAFRVALISPLYETAARARTPVDDEERFLSGLARGDLVGVPVPDGMARAIAAAFGDATLPADLAALLDQKRIGEAVLDAMDRIATGTEGDVRGVTEGLTLLRRIGLESVARRTALQLMVLERRG